MSAVWNTLDFVSDFLHRPIIETSGLIVDGHLMLEIILLVVIVLLMMQKSYKPDATKQFSEREIEQLVEEWNPEPLHGELPPEVLNRKPPVLESAAEPWTMVNGKKVLNLTSFNFLGFIGNPSIKAACTQAISKYGVGSCGPRGFYGTIDVHMDLEARLAKFVGTDDCIIYSYGLATASSTIPAFCKRGDLIIADEGVGWAIQNGITLSRSSVRYFRHNDMGHLRSILEDVERKDKAQKRPLYRRFIVVEAIYLSSGLMAPLTEIVKLKEEFKYRVVVEESLSLGVLGSTGRGIAEHYGINPKDVDIILSTMGTTLASAGGFCCGNKKVADHQRLGGLGYCFSASLPPYLASGALAALDEMEGHPELKDKLQQNIMAFRDEMSNSSVLRVQGHDLSPVQLVFLDPSALAANDKRKSDDVLHTIVDKMLEEEQTLVSLPERSALDTCKLPLGIRVSFSAGHSVDDVKMAATKLKQVAQAVVREG